MNCWEFKNCGRQEGGASVAELGICAAYPNGGNHCAIVAGTLCGGQVQGSFAAKLRNCLKCDFYASEHYDKTYAKAEREQLLQVVDVRTKQLRESLEQLEQSEDNYRNFLELAGDGIFIGAHRKIKFANKAFAQMLDTEPKELVDTDYYQYVPSDENDNMRQRSAAILEGSDIELLYETRLKKKNGEEIPVEINTKRIEMRGERFTIATVRDISERKRMQEQLMVSDRLASLGELASGIAHEINNPLTSIIGFSNLILEGDVPADIKEDLVAINKEANRTVGVVRNLLTFARKHPKKKEAMDINESIQKVLELRVYEQNISNITVITQFGTDIPKIIADFFQLQQVFLNLVINAEFFMSEAHGGGTINITTTYENNKVRVVFTDDGPGIKAETLEHLFDPFFTTKDVGKGTGFGLSISYGIIQDHNGTIRAESKDGKGATFIIELPISEGNG